MKKIPFLSQFITNPRTVGAILPSSNYLGDKMTENINFQEAKYIVEYGPGTGVFTEKIIKKRNPNTVILLIENNLEFYFLLREKYLEVENVHIQYGSAEQIERYLKEFEIPYVDYIISGLPFSSLPKNVSHNILLNSAKILKDNGLFITFQYTQLKKAFIKKFFARIDTKREFRNFPPAYIFSCCKVKKHTEELEDVKNTHC